MLNLIGFPKGAEIERLKVLYPTKEDYDNALIWSGRLVQLIPPQKTAMGVLVRVR